MAVTLVSDSELGDRLRAVPGVSAVEVQGSAELPGRIRLRLGSGADPGAVMREVREIMGSRGLRVRTAPPRAKVEPVEAPPPPPSPSGPSERRVRPVRAEREEPAPRGGVSRLASVGLEEGPDRVRVRVAAADGRTVTREARPGRRGLEEAVLQAVAALMDPEGPVPGLVAVEERPVDDEDLLVVVLEGADGRRRTGSAIVRTGWAFALARSVWAALALGD